MCVRASQDAILHRGMLIAKSLLCDLYSALDPYCKTVFVRIGWFSQIQLHTCTCRSNRRHSYS